MLVPHKDLHPYKQAVDANKCSRIGRERMTWLCGTRRWETTPGSLDPSGTEALSRDVILSLAQKESDV